MNAATGAGGLALIALAAAPVGCGGGERSPAAASSGGSAQAGDSQTAGGGGSASGTPNGGMPGSGGTPSFGGTMGGGGAAGAPMRVCVNDPVEPVNCGATCTAVRANGPPDNRVSLVLLGEGFTEPELGDVYAPHAEAVAKYMFENANDSEPYVRYKRFINFYRIDLVSNESGIDDHGEEFVPRGHGLAPGRHTVEARAHDDTEWVRLERTTLEQVVTWQVELSDTI